jgi:hypothetical protein
MLRLNLPGSDLYDPRMAWVAKARPDGRVATDLFIYRDDFRRTRRGCVPAGEYEGWERVKPSGYPGCYLEVEGASWKPGPWVRSIAYTDDPEEGIWVLSSQKK